MNREYTLFEPIVCAVCSRTVYRMKGRDWKVCSRCRQKRGEQTYVDWLGWDRANETNEKKFAVSDH